MSDGAQRSVLLYGGERSIRLEVARLLRDDGTRVLLATSAAEAAKAAKALGGRRVDAIGALSPLPFAPDSSGDGGPSVVHAVEHGSEDIRDGRAETDALAWVERIRRVLVEQDGQPTSSA